MLRQVFQHKVTQGRRIRCGHVPQVESPAQTHRAVLKFLQSGARSTVAAA